MVVEARSGATTADAHAEEGRVDQPAESDGSAEVRTAWASTDGSWVYPPPEDPETNMNSPWTLMALSSAALAAPAAAAPLRARPRSYRA